MRPSRCSHCHSYPCTCDEPIPGEQCNGQPVTWRQMHKAFELVEPASNWKLPIDRTLQLTGPDLDLVLVAVPFFTGSSACVEYPVRGENGDLRTVRITAAGYYAAVGA